MEKLQLHIINIINVNFTEKICFHNLFQNYVKMLHFLIFLLYIL